MAAPDESPPEPRRPLSRARVLRAALALADGGGIESLSMRRLGQELGVEAMSLYNHVTNKDDLRRGIVEFVLAEIDLPDADADWRPALRRTAVSAHDAFVRHRWACPELMRQADISPARMRWMDAVLGTLRAAGFSADLTHHAYHALDSHITGFTLWQVSMPFDTGRELAGLAETALRVIPVEDYPHLVEHVHQHLAAAGNGPTEFEFGLELILDGLARLRTAEPATPTSIG